MRFRCFAFLLICLFSHTAWSQEEDNIPEFNTKNIQQKFSEKKGPFKRENIIIGGSLDLGVSNTIGYFMVAPSLGCRVVEAVEVGIGTGYTLLTDFNTQSQHNFSGGPYLKLYPDRSFFIQAEGQLTYVSTNKLTYSNALVGIGYNSFIGERAYISTGIKLNLIANEIYRNTRFPMPFFSFFWRLK